MGGNYRHIGKPTQRKDARSIVTGRAEYIDDLRMAGMLYGRVLRSPYPHARIKHIDTTKAEAYPGVITVLTYKNVPKWLAGVPYHRPVLDSKVNFVGDAVALLAAETEQAADEALELIEVEYEELPAVYDMEAASKPGAPQIHERIPNNIFPRGFKAIGEKALQELVMGDVEKGFAEADIIEEATCGYENIPNPLPPEPPGVVALWEDPEHLTIYVASQSAPMNRNFAMPALGLVDIRVIGMQCGGSYGTKNANFIPMAHAAALAKAAGKPVKVYFNKEEHFNAYTLRLGSRIHARIGIKKDGTVTAVEGEWFVDTGAASEMAQVQVAVGLGETQLLIRCPNWNVQPTLVCTNRSPSGVVRGFGGQELNCALLPLLTVVMEKADLDPVEFFKKNYIGPGAGFFWRDGIWWDYRGIDFSKVLDKSAEIFGWKNKWKGWNKPTAVNGSKITGVGVGLHGNADIGEDESEAHVKISPDGRALVHACVSESGMGERSSLCKMAAEVLNLPLDRVNIAPPDTLVNPFEFGLVGSRGTYTVGSAVIQAAEDARRQLLERAAPMLKVPAEELDTKDGVIFAKSDPAKEMAWYKAMGIARTITGQGRFDVDFSLSNCMIIFAEVEIDTDTGKLELKHIVASTDCGQVIDPLVLEGQLHGCLGSAGLDTAVFEETILDKDTGHIVNCNMIDYKWRTFADLPPFDTLMMETPIDSHRFHAVGVGEIAPAPGAAAVLMAVNNAIGKKIMTYPATPQKVLKALGKI
ncbi:MAG: xanthine dehydrogenase family protein molybdopterin-binding subunit [Dehalococcoidia bacterium]|jgi:xanthine dehydrogenase molybdenum-binding subunit